MSAENAQQAARPSYSGPDDCLKLAGSPAFVSLIGLSKRYQEGDRWRVVLDEVSVDLARGEFTALLGRSGSGKSTLLNLVSGIDRPDAGAVWIGGQNLTAMSERARTLFRRRQIGFVFQFFNLIPTLTVLENVTLPLELDGLAPHAAIAAAQPLLAEVGLLERAAAFPDRLSGGEQQRVAIARALVHDPALVLADEPTGNLDESTGRSVLALLDRLTRQAGRNLLMVTHSAEAAAAADRLFQIHEGRLVCAGGPRHSVATAAPAGDGAAEPGGRPHQRAGSRP